MNIHFDGLKGARLSPLQERALREAYGLIYDFAGAKKEDHFIFTSSGAEAVNHAIWAAYLDITRKTGKNHFLCSALDEAATIMAMGRLQEVGSLFQMVAPRPEGFVTVKEVAEMLTPRTAMLSLSWANGLTGVIQPLVEIADLCRERDILFHVEGTHVLGKGNFSFLETGADLLTFNGPYPGTGGMFIREGLEISPLILGGNEQGKMRGGAFSVNGLIEMAKWAKDEKEHADHYSIEIARLRSYFEELICKHLPNVTPLFYAQERRVSHITSFLFPGAASDSLYYLLSQKGVYTSFGGNHFQHFVHILRGCGVPEPDCHSGLSFTFSHSTTQEEIEKAAEKVIETVCQLRKYSQNLIWEPV